MCTSYKQHGMSIMKSHMSDFDYIYPQCNDYQKFCISRLCLLFSKFIAFYFIDLNKFYQKNMNDAWNHVLTLVGKNNKVLSKYEKQRAIFITKILFRDVVGRYDKLCKYIDTYLPLGDFPAKEDIAMIFRQVGDSPFLRYIVPLINICFAYVKEVRTNCPQNVIFYNKDQLHFLALKHYFGFFNKVSTLNQLIRRAIQDNNERSHVENYPLFDRIWRSKQSSQGLNNLANNVDINIKLWPKWKNIASIKWCHFCRKNDVVLKKCKGCQVFYCGVVCQKKDWNLKNHKSVCMTR